MNQKTYLPMAYRVTKIIDLDEADRGRDVDDDGNDPPPHSRAITGANEQPGTGGDNGSGIDVRTNTGNVGRYDGDDALAATRSRAATLEVDIEGVDGKGSPFHFRQKISWLNSFFKMMLRSDAEITTVYCLSNLGSFDRLPRGRPKS